MSHVCSLAGKCAKIMPVTCDTRISASGMSLQNNKEAVNRSCNYICLPAQ